MYFWFFFKDEVGCVDLVECQKICDNFVGCFNIVYFKFVLEFFLYGMFQFNVYNDFIKLYYYSY